MENSARNISRTDAIFAYVISLKDNLRGLFKYHRTYRNFLRVVFHILTGRYPFEATLRNGQKVVLNNRFATSVIGDSQGHGGAKFDITNNTVTIFSSPYIKDNETSVKIWGGIYDGDVMSTFFTNRYEFLPLDGADVIDIGANIGDTAIFFALKGAKRVIGIEPFPKNYELAKKNVESNNLSNKITLILAGCASNSSYITIDPSYDSNSRSVLIDKFNDGIQIPLLTLCEVLAQSNGRSELILKMDCEGCEYQTIISSSEETLQRFSHIFIEYHDGYRNLKEKLERAGFAVSVSRPVVVSDDDYFFTKHFTGYLFAKR